MHDPFTTPGAFSWNELMTSDPGASKAFYRDLFDWQMDDADIGGSTYTVVKTTDGQGIGGIMAIPKEAAGMPPAWGAYVTVADVDATVGRAESLGATILVPPRDIPEVGRFAWLRDPQGASLGIIAYKRPS
jgi:uncharacterized protein